MKWTCLPLFAILLTAEAATGQTALSGQPRVLSTVPEPPAGADAVPAQMSGVPLQVGDLPPGIVATRVIRRTFEQNVAGQVVQMRLGTGRVVEAMTGADGRAQFPALAVGDLVRVRTTLDGEVLESQPVPIPSQGGVRLVLVGGVGAGSTSSELWPADAPPAGTNGAAVNAGATTPVTGSTRTPAFTYVTAAALFSVIGAGVVLWPGRRRARTPVAADLRTDVFEQLVQLEKDFEEGRVATAEHEVQREALIQELLVS